MALRSQAKGLSAILNEIARNPTGELAFDLLNQAEETVQQSLGFRFQAAATEQRRDRILTLFLDLYRARHNMVGSDEEVKHRAFQETSEEIINSARL